MATQSLYRRYRPRRFSELKGQDHVVKALRDSVREGREGQAYLFSGPRGTGKTTTARILAKVLNCKNVVDGEPCCECESCLAVERGTSYDVHELDAASNNGVDAIRDLIERASLGTPGRHKVYILDEVHMLSKPASAALLKTLEEPPPATVIVLVSGEPSRLLATIRSRCRTLALPMPAAEAALAWLAAEGVAQPRVALAVAGGAPLLARELAQPEEAQLRQRVIAELSRPSGSDPLAFAERIDRTALERTIYWMQTWVHDLLRIRSGAAVRHHTDFAPAAQAKARAADPEALFDLERELRAARALASHPLNARLVAEHLLMSYNRATSGARK
jgi:energy-coupling factor transporter ATP-binding protein EcfA2